MNYTVILTIGIYIVLLLSISIFIGRKNTNNDAFFRANRQSKWWMVAIGMIGTSISGVSFVSVPGMVSTIQFGYLQMVLGFFFGYVIIAKVLLPLYYKLDLTSIYTYLETRFGKRTYHAGASFFIIGKIIGAAARLYIVALILQKTVFDTWQIPFELTVMGTVLLIWLYTQKSGIKTLVWTDMIQTIILILALIMIAWAVVVAIGMDTRELITTLLNSPHTRIFVFDDWHSKQYFWKQFLSGIFIPIVMTGLDQDQMQKNLTCRSLSEAQKNMYWYGAAFLPINFIFLILGAMLLLLATQANIPLPASTDELLPLFASQYLGTVAFILFILGITAAAFSSADSALAAITTSISIDLLHINHIADRTKAEKSRKKIHFFVAVGFVFIILLIRHLHNTNILDTIYMLVGYTYGPLLGLYAFGLFTQRVANDRFAPYITIAAPILSYLFQIACTHYFHYQLGYELLMLNGILTFVGLWFFGKNTTKTI